MALSCPASFRCGDLDCGRLLRLLGKRQFAALQLLFGGRRLWIPKAGARMPCAVCLARDRCIRSWKDRGASARTISKHLGISAKSIYRVLARH